MNIKISVIIPVYNVEKYLRQCVDSVLSQTYSDLEIILVDDGSPDNCPCICDEYSRRDTRVKVIHKPNGGLSDARNHGLRYASGEYVLFLDSDDYYNNDNFLEEVVERINETKADMICFQRITLIDTIPTNYKYSLPYSESELSKNDLGQLVLKLSSSGRLDASACMKAINLKIIKDNNLYFKKGIFCEDIEWFLRILDRLESIAVSNSLAYCYRLRESSISHNISAKNINDLFFSIETHADYFKNSHNTDFRNGILNYLLYQYYIVLGYVNRYLNGEQYVEMINKCKQYRWLNDYAISFKTKKCRLLFKLTGIKVTGFILGKYLKSINR